MEPLHSDKNDENSGGSYRRRISSILKTPHKSARFPDPSQQENEVECAKPVDKRNSRRVTFAPANDVLLYSKDVKNASLVRSPFQELMSASVPAENSAQVSVSEDGIHQKMGMDPLIGAPLHVYEQKGNANIEPGEVFGEKTVTFSGEDSFMESQTINITGHQDYLVGASQNNRTLLSCGKNTAMSSGDGKSMKLSLGHGANVAREVHDRVASSERRFDPCFNNLLACILSPYGSNVEPDETMLNMTTVDVDKENQDHTLVHSETGTIGVCQDEKSKTDMTVTHTGHIAGLKDDADDPFRCFFPQQEMCSQSGTASQASPNTKTLQKHTRITLGSPNLKDTFKEQSTEKKMIFTAEDACMDMTDFFCEEKSGLFASSTEKKDRATTGQSASSEKNVDPKFEEFLAKDFKTDGTKVNPGHSGMAHINPLAKATEEPFNGNPIHPKDDLTIDMTEFQRCDIRRCLPAQVRHPKGRQTAFQQLFPDTLPTSDERTVRFTANDGTMDMTQSLKVNIDTPFEPGTLKNTGGENTVIKFSANDVATNVTQSLTSVIDTQLEPEVPKSIRSVPAGEEKTIRFSENDAAMDMTQGLAAVIDTPFEPEAHHNARKEKPVRYSSNGIEIDMTGNPTANIATYLELGAPHNEPTGKEKTIQFSVNHDAMDMTQSLTSVNDTQSEPEVPKNVHREPAREEKTIQFSANDAAIDVTQSLTAAIDTQLEPEIPQNIRRVPAGEEKMLRFSANDAAMDTMQSLTAAIDTWLEPEVPKHIRREPAGEEKVIRFSANDAAMDMMQSLTSVIDTQLKPEVPKYICHVPAGEEKLIRFSANDAAMDRTQSLTSVIDTQSEAEVPKNIHRVPAREEKTIRFSANDAAMDRTQSLTSVIDTQSEAEVPKNIHRVPAREEKTIRFSANDAAMDRTQSLTSVIDTQSEAEVPKNIHRVPAREEKTIRFSANDAAMDMTQSLPTRFETSQDAVESPDAVNSEETQNSKEAELRNKTSPLSQKLSSPSTGDHGRHSSPSRKSRRSSIADLQLKLRRLSHIMTSEVIPPDSTAFLPNLDSDADKSTKYNNDLSVSEFVPDIKAGSGNAEDSETQSGPQGSAIVGSPFAFKTTELMSTLSTGGFQQKLPQRKTRSSQSNSREKSVSWTKIDNIVDKLKTWNDGDVRNICDEELVSCDESFQTMDDKSPPKENSFIMEEFSIDEVFLNNVLRENSPDGVQGTKRCLASDEHNTENKKKMKASSVMFPEAVATEIQAQVLEIDHRADTTIVPSSSNHTMDSSSSTRSNNSSCDATFNPTFKHSMMESHFEDREVQKLKDGSITVLEFLRLFNIDFVIHEPRQSILPDKFPHATGCSAMDVLKNRHVYHPKKLVYEADFNNLSEKVEGLNYRMLDKNKSLKVINYQLWANLKDWTEKEIKSFGIKLKERHNSYRKMSKIHRHEMKEVLYSNLVQTLKDEQQKFKSAIESNEMIKILDDCICDLEAELAAVEDKGSEDMPSLKSLQEEMIKVNEALDDKNRQICELELEKTQASGKLVRLKAETKNLQSFIGVLEKLTEWRVREKTETHTLYTFLYDTLCLQLVHAGDSAEPDRKISQINFKFVLDDEKSQSHARIAHKLLSQHIERETAWVEKYPTNSYIPKLLHDLSLVVSTCRLLGEELRLLKMWGGLRLNIVDISCQDTRVNIVFSSLRRRSRFEVVLSVSLAKQCYVLHVHSFQNFFGDARAEQIDQILKSFSTGRNLLTKTIKKINCDLLC
ncbi:uncharacterized protein knl1 isoform X2 [Syngnathus acus]|uniref:uncharacterized protein knl1 isoform X2 n=1 Tax=Syngnathus acus TaxID=161584 RepID=UPI001885C667|nr:uncharacterized protein knl1 isoform X2 [Syngnathus acus]